MTAFSSTRRLLLVEHDPGVRDLLQAFLTREGYEVFLVSSPQEALTLLDEHPFHLVLTDLFRTPGSDPFRALELLRGQSHPIPVGVITGWNVKEEEVIQRGFVCLVRKPFDLEALLTSIAVCLNIPLSPAQGGARSASYSLEVEEDKLSRVVWASPGIGDASTASQQGEQSQR